MRNFHTLGLSAALVTTVAYAQPAATLDDITVVGAPDLLANYLKVSLSVQPGALLSSVNPRVVEQEALATGFFSKVQAQLNTVDGRDVLALTVVPNPSITQVSVSGATFVPEQQILTFLAENLNIAPEATLNTARVEDSKAQLQAAYRQAGFPFNPPVSAEIQRTEQGAAINYAITETAPVSRAEVTGATQLSPDVIRTAFSPLTDSGTFTLPLYRQALQAIANAYEQKGLRGSGVDVQATDLQDGVLKVTVAELKVAGVDTSALGDVRVPLRTKPGTLLNTELLSGDLRALTNAAGRPVRYALQQDPANPAAVSVTFTPGEEQTGPIKEVRIANATAVPVDEIAKVLNVRLGDTYSPLLAQEDYLAIQRLYNSRGFEVLTTPDPISYRDGVLTFNVREARLAGYELRWEGPHATKDRVVLRELPAPGGVLNANALQRAIGNNLRSLGFVVPVGLQTRVDPQNPQDVTVVLTLKEESTNSFTPGIAYDTISGWSGDVALQGNNLFGQGLGYDLSVRAAPNDVGQYFSGGASFTVPWLDFDFLDFRQNRTSLSIGASSNVTGNNPIVDPATGAASGREFTQRSTGGQIGLSRAITPNLSAGLTASVQYNTSFLEPVGGENNADEPTIDDATAAKLVADPGLTTLLGANLLYSSVTYPEFPTDGFRASASVARGFGFEGPNVLGWNQAEVGARKYFGFGQTLEDGNWQQAVAFRVNAGSIFGAAPATRLFAVGGSEPGERTSLKGFEAGSFLGKNYVTSSVEYRYNFNVNNAVARGIYGILFLDAGDAWTNANDFNIQTSYGAGVQLNLGIANFLLPALRFDYVLSPTNNSSRFHFRLGGLF